MRILLIWCLLTTTHWVCAAELSLGLGMASGQSEYADQPSQSQVFPMAFYRGDRFFISGLNFGFDLVKDDKLSLSIVGDLDFRRFEPDQADTASFAVLDERKSGLLGGIRLEHKLTKLNTFKYNLMTELSDRHGATIADVSWQHNFDLKLAATRFFSIVKLRAVDAKYNQYYAGISADEATSSGLLAYSPDSDIDLSLSLGAMHFFPNKWQLLAFVNYRQYGNEVENSPMIIDTQVFGVFVGAAYRF